MPGSEPFKVNTNISRVGDRKPLPKKATTVVAEINGKKIYWLGIRSRWTPLHTKILVMYNEGKSHLQMSKHLNLDRDVIETITSSDMFKRRSELAEEKVIQTVAIQRSEVADIDAVMEARRMITEATVPAALQLTKMANEEGYGNRVMLEACKDILDRAGLKPITITETRERVYSPAEVNSAKVILEEAQDIVKRLSHTPSSFVLSDMSQGRLASSDTDISSDAESSSSTSHSRQANVPAQPLLPV